MQINISRTISPVIHAHICGSYSNLRVILKCNGEFIYTPPLYLCFAAEKRPPPLVSVSLRLALDSPPSRRAAGAKNLGDLIQHVISTRYF